MQIERYMTDEAVLAELGARLQRMRLERNLTQRELAEEAGVERKAVLRIEDGSSVTLTSFIRILRALGLLEALNRFVPEPVPSPIELLKLHGKRRRRATGERGKSAPQQDEGAPWHWGDEEPPHEESTSQREGDESPNANS